MYRWGMWNTDEKGFVQMAKTLEDANISSILLPYGPRGIDFSIYLSAMLMATNNIRMLLALPAYGVTPEFAAKTFETVNYITPSRMDLNLVAGKITGENERTVLESYPGDTSLIDDHYKRVRLTEPWMDKFVDLMNKYGFKANLCVVGTSDTTIRLARKHADYLIVGDYQLTDTEFDKIKDMKLILIMDPLVLKDGQDIESVEYVEHNEPFKPDHKIRGTKDEVVNQIKNISNKYGIHDFMIVTYQKDLSGIFEVIQDLKKSQGSNILDCLIDHTDQTFLR
jgi:alkanesulfonate monooxygenase SsuD/methylene tetrahydromethanopterin reductase-like flavin-dependent oxidoreductase (luciferase family)